MNRPTVTATYEQDLEIMEGQCGHPYVLVHPGVIVEVTFPLHDHEAALDALDRAVADVRSQIEETRTCRKAEPVDVIEEPPVGSQVTDCMGDVWERREEGWALWWPARSGWVADLHGGELVDPWPVVRDQAPLRFTTDEDRKRVGLPAEPAEITEEPPVRRVNVTITDVYAAPDDYGFLRINVGPETAVIDPNASNVTVTDVESADITEEPTSTTTSIRDAASTDRPKEETDHE